jgi:predicted transcriptional regulator of viral defense system
VEKAPRVKKAKAPKAVKPAIAKRVKQAGKKAPAEKRVTNIDTVVGLIQGAREGISTAELKTKTGLIERQIWAIVNRASKEGKIRKMKRGVYGGVIVVAEASSDGTTK